MSSQIFKTSIPKEIFYAFLEANATKKTNYYIFTKVVFKSAQYNETVIPFLDKIKNHYFPSKQNYVTRKMTYKNFITILWKQFFVIYDSIHGFQSSYFLICFCIVLYNKGIFVSMCDRIHNNLVSE